jgi:hypothetical protein
MGGNAMNLKICTKCKEQNLLLKYQFLNEKYVNLESPQKIKIKIIEVPTKRLSTLIIPISSLLGNTPHPSSTHIRSFFTRAHTSKSSHLGNMIPLVNNNGR